MQFACAPAEGSRRTRWTPLSAGRHRQPLPRLCMVLMGLGLMILATTSRAAQEQNAEQLAGVENNRAGAYRALAQLSYQAFTQGDKATAAELARILERVWDRGEGDGGPTALSRTNRPLFAQLDHAMDVFIQPLINYAALNPDVASVLKAYQAFLQQLKQMQ